MFLNVRILKAHVGYVQGLHFFHIRCRVALTVREAAGGESLELHDILGKCASFVRENIMNGPEFLVQVRGLRSGGHIFVSVINHPIILDHDCLEEFNSFESNQHRDGHYV
jgi:hypothetical protein